MFPEDQLQHQMLPCTCLNQGLRPLPTPGPELGSPTTRTASSRGASGALPARQLRGLQSGLSTRSCRENRATTQATL